MSHKLLQELSGFTIQIGKFRSNLILKKVELNRVVPSENESIKVGNLRIETPLKRVIIEDISFTVTRGENVIIKGNNGSGKSSIFRVLAGLWALKGGEVEVPKEIFFSPQTVYLPKGTLIEQVIYPRTKELTQEDRKEVEMLIRAADIGHILDREEKGLDAEQDWTDLLSGGEKQRIMLTRVLFHKPKFAFLGVLLNRSKLFCNCYQ